MQITETVSEGLKRELKVVIEAQELDERLKAKLDEVKDKVQLKGFRPGKVPIEHIKKVYGRSLMAEVLEQTVQETSGKAITEREERPAFQPAISFEDETKVLERAIEGGNDLTYTMAFEILPQIELVDFKTLTIEKPVAEVTDEEIGEALTRIQEGNTDYEAKDGAAESKDRLTIDFLGKIDGEPFEGGKGEDVHVVLGAGSFIPGFEEGLEGVKAGDETTINVTFPEEYGAKHLAGKPAEFEVKVKEVAGPKLPELNDDFAKNLGLDSLEKLKGIVSEQISKDYTGASRAKAKRALLDALDNAHTFELPPSLVDNEFDVIWNEVKQQHQHTGKSFEDENTTEEKAREEYRAMAIRRVKLGLVLSEIGQKNQVTVTDEEVQKAIINRARQYPGQERKVIEFYKENPNALLELRAPIFEEKVVDFALELANVTEKTVSREELFHIEEDDEVKQIVGTDSNNDPA
ncbi:MAG: trigger factor [Alphaproteobacteria bacterium]